jgi:hypothetical protein
MQKKEKSISIVCLIISFSGTGGQEDVQVNVGGAVR